MPYILRESSEAVESRVIVSKRENGYVYFTALGDTSNTLNRLAEALFDAQYVDESTLRLEEGG